MNKRVINSLKKESHKKPQQVATAFSLSYVLINILICK